MGNKLELTQDEKAVLENVYGRQNFASGYSPNKLEAILELTAREKKFFAGKNFKSSHFFIQTLYKVAGSVNPIKFTLAINKVIADNENLRANFCNVGERTIKVIHPASFVKPEIVFRNLMNIKRDDLEEEMARIFAAEVRREVSLEHDPLIRFAVYKTGKDDFAVMVTMAQLIYDYFDAEEFFVKLFDLTAEVKPKKIPEPLPPKNYEAILEYWAKIFQKAPPPSVLPYAKKGEGPYRQRAFNGVIAADLLSELLAHAQSNRIMLMAILQTAWGFMLQFANKRRDCIFCQVSSTENFSLSVIPIRLSVDDDSTVEEIVRNQFRQLLVSQPYKVTDWTILDELTVQKKLFNHFLNFKEFTASELSYANYVNTPAEPLGKVIYQASWDAQDMDFGAYFRYSNKKLLTAFIYDAEKFLEGGVEKIFNLYLAILQQMIADWYAKYAEFSSHLAEHMEIQLKAEPLPPEDARKKLIDFISQLPVLQGRYSGTIRLFQEHGKIITRYEGDRISDEMLSENFIFVADGILSRNVDTGDGWYTTLDIIEKNCFVNPMNLLELQPFEVSVTVLTEQAELLVIPHDIFIEILRKTPEVAMSLMNYALEQLGRYQVLWLKT